MPWFAIEHDDSQITGVYQEIDVSNRQNERLYLIIDIDNFGGCHGVLISEPYHQAGYIDDFEINGNGATFYIDNLVSEGHYLQIHNAYPVGDDHHPVGEILRQ